MLDLAEPAHAETLDLPDWAAAEILDAPLPDYHRLRALVVRLGARRWQWSISSLEEDRGELIACGVEKTAAAARHTATAEIGKCLADPLA